MWPALRSSAVIATLSAETRAVKRRMPSWRARCGQPGEQLVAQPAALPVISDRDGDFGRVRVSFVPDVTGHSDAAPVTIQCAERLVVMVVDVGEVAQLGRRQLVLDGEEPHPAGSSTQPGEALGQERSITATDRPDQHRRSVTQPDPTAARRGPVPVPPPHHPRRPAPGNCMIISISARRRVPRHRRRDPEHILPGSAGAMLTRHWNGGPPAWPRLAGLGAGQLFSWRPSRSRPAIHRPRPA